MFLKLVSLILIFHLIVIGVASDEGKSLFDDLPLNGAYNSETDEIPPIGEEEEKVQLSPSNSNNTKKPKLSWEKIFQQRSSESNSLFDSMPNQGALNQDHIFESKTQKRGILPSSNGEVRFQLEIERQHPTAEFNLNNFHANQLPTIVHHIANGEVPLRTVSPPPLVPLVPLPVVHGNAISVSPPSRLYGTPVPTPVRTLYNAQKNPDNTVIIYGTPVPTLKKPHSPEIHNHYYPTREEVRNHYYTNLQRRPKIHHATHVDSRTEIPIITGQSHGYGSNTGNENVEFTTQAPIPPTTTTQFTTQRPIFTTTTRPPPSFDQGDYDYDALQDTRKHVGFDSRTGKFTFNEPSSYRIPSIDSKSYYNQRQPSDTYGPPPAPTYGPPQNNQPPAPPPSYGPPPKVEDIPAPVPPPPQATSTTSISYQTIPIQTVQTQLVTVPQITVSSSSAVEEEGGRPQSPGRPMTQPSTTYGLPLNSFSQDTPNRGGLASGALFTDDQLALLISASRGFGADSIVEDDTVSILGGGNRGLGNIFNLNPEISAYQYPIQGARTRFGINQPSLFNSPIPVPIRSFGSRPAVLSSQDQLLALLAQQQRLGGLRNQDLGFRNSPVLTGDAVDAVADILREQRLRGAVSDLRGRLRHENRNADRVRRNYRSLFYKGALLLSALTLLPTVATPFAAAASGISTPHFLLPIASGRRRRSISSDKSGIMAPFEICKESLQINSDANTRLKNYLNCINNTTETSSESSLFDSMPFNGAFVPEEIRADLEKYVSPSDILKNSECLQKRFCETYIEIQNIIPNTKGFIDLYTAFAKDIETNPWIKHAMTAGRDKNCNAFYCYQDYNTNLSKNTSVTSI